MADGTMQTFKVYTISENASREDPTKGWGQWVLLYVKDGKTVGCKHVCGKYSTKENGEIWYRAGGMNAKDYETMKPHWPKVMELLRNPPPIPQPEGEAASAPDLDAPPF